MRYKYISLHAQAMIGIFSPSELYQRCIEGLPEDATFIRLYPDPFYPNGDARRVVFESASWDEVKEGDPIPEYHPLFKVSIDTGKET